MTFGGSTSDALGLSIERYNPQTDQWHNAGSLQHSRYWHRAVELSDGRVLIAGGHSSGTAALWDPATETLRLTGSPHVLHGGSATLSLFGSDAILAGGFGDTETVSEVERFDPVTETWTVIEQLQDPRKNHTATVLANGNIIIAGGSDRRGRDFRSTEQIFSNPIRQVCGDGVLQSEACDDGNTVSANGCSANCTVETGWMCTGAPSVCTQNSGHVGTPGDWSYCTLACPCSADLGDYDSNAECTPGLVCLHDVGLTYGYSSSALDVCDVPQSGSCHNGNNGDWSYCSAGCP